MDAVKSFNAELSSLYEVKPPISKAKMTAITRGAIKAIKFYKHVVQSVEKFILKCKPEYKVPGLYVIDSIVRQSRHQFGTEKDVFAPRFAKNMRQTFLNLFVCPNEDKSKIIRVLNLWQKNHVFAPDVIQPLFDLADPNNPIHKELGTPVQTNGLNTSTVAVKGSPALQKTPTKGSQQGNEGVHHGGNLNVSDPSVLAQLQQLQRLLTRSVDASSKSEVPVHFDRKLLDFDYGDDDDEAHSSPKQPPSDSVSSLLTNPEVLRQLQTIQQTMTAGQTGELDIDKLRKLQEMKKQEDEFDKHLAQTVPNLPFADQCEFKPSNSNIMSGSYFLPSGADLTQPPPGYKSQPQFEMPPVIADNDIQFVDDADDVEVITLDHGDSRSVSPQDERYNRRRRSRSRERSRDRRDRGNDRGGNDRGGNDRGGNDRGGNNRSGGDRGERDRRSRRSRSRSKTRRHRTRSRERIPITTHKEKESEKDKERKKRGLPTIKKDNLSVCSTTLWVGHLSKLVHQEDLSNTFGEFGDIVSIDLIPPRGCAFIVMHRRQDATRCLTKLKNHNMHGKAITLAWAPGKGVKGKDLKDYWEGDLGVSYIPWTKLKPDIDLELLEDGGMVDEDTMPVWMKAKIAVSPEKLALANPIPMDPSCGFISLPPEVRTTVDTSQPPPVPGGGLLQPPPMAMPLVSPFQFSNRLMGMNMPPGLMSNVPIGVPPPNMTGAFMQNQAVGLGSPFQSNMMPPPVAQMPGADNSNQANSSDSGIKVLSLTDSLLNLAQQQPPFGMLPQPPGPPHDDNMDIEMEDAEKPERQPLLSEQLQASLMQMNRGGFGDIDHRRDRRGNDRDRRNSGSRERDRDRNRDRGRGMRDEGYPERDDNRGRDRRDRPNRWGDREADPVDRRDREKTLNDRLQQMAMANDGGGGGGFMNHDRPPRDIIPEPVIPPMMDNRHMYPHDNNAINPELGEMYLEEPQDEFDPGLIAPPLIEEYPPMIEPDYPPMIEPDYPPMIEPDYPPMIEPDYPPMIEPDYPSMLEPEYPPMMEEPMHPRMMRDDFEPPPPDRFVRVRRDFRDNNFEPPRGRGPPGPDFFPPRDGFGPRGMMRGGPQRPPMMRGPGPHKFHPRGPPMRGPRPSPPWRDRPNFGPRFDHQDFHRGPGGPPPMFDEPPHMRHRGGRFEDRRRGHRPDFNAENMPEPPERFEKRSRWGDQRHDEPELQAPPEFTEVPIENENKGGNTPLHDENVGEPEVPGEQAVPVKEAHAPQESNVQPPGDENPKEAVTTE